MTCAYNVFVLFLRTKEKQTRPLQGNDDHEGEKKRQSITDLTREVRPRPASLSRISLASLPLECRRAHFSACRLLSSATATWPRSTRPSRSESRSPKRARVSQSSMAAEEQTRTTKTFPQSSFIQTRPAVTSFLNSFQVTGATTTSTPKRWKRHA